jgi:hypothetical protein
MNVSIALLRNRLSDWERLYEVRLADSDLRLWIDTFRDVRCEDDVLLEAFTLVQHKAVKFPKPAHLVAAIETARETRQKSTSILEDLEKSPHISDLTPEERAEMTKTFVETLASVGVKMKVPPVRMTDAAANDERNRQKDAFAARFPHAAARRPMDASQPSSGAAPPAASPAPIAVESAEPTPEDLAEEPPFEAKDEDIPF